LGNISQGNDFIYTDQPLDASVKFDLPLCFKAQALTLSDTLEIDEGWDEDSIEGKIILKAINGFPFSASVNLKIIDENGSVVATFASGESINSAMVTADDATSAVESYIDVELQQGNLNAISPEHQWLIEVVFDTYGEEFVKIRESYFIDIRIMADMSYGVEVN
jgi:hypothetical protein